MKLIDKDALVAEIEKIIADETESIKCFEHSKNVSEVQRSNSRIGVLTHLRSFLNTLEVKEVDINKEISQFVDANFEKATIGHKLSLRRVAKHFFELGVLCPINNINIEEVKAAAKVWSEDDENTRGCDYIGAVVAERAFVACAEWLINKAQKGEEV